MILLPHSVFPPDPVFTRIGLRWRDLEHTILCSVSLNSPHPPTPHPQSVLGTRPAELFAHVLARNRLW